MAKFSSREDVERWLYQRQRGIAVTIAARAALRAVPALSLSPSQGDGNAAETARAIILWMFRATATAWVTARFPGHGMRLLVSADAATRQIPASRMVVDSSNPLRAALAAADAAATKDADIEAAYVNDAAIACDAAARAAVSLAVAEFHRDPAIAYVDTTAEIEARMAPFADGASASAWNDVSLDADEFERLASTRGRSTLAAQIELAGYPLLSSREVSNLAAWQKLALELLHADEDWDVWTRWYLDRANGNSPNEALEIARVMISETLWKQGPKVVNAEIKRLIQEHSKTEPKSRWGEAKWGEFRWDGKDEPPLVPAQRPAAVEPIWAKGRLTVPKKPAKAELNKKKFAAALSALRVELRELVDDVGAEANIDKRPAAFLRRLVERIPESMPQQDELFRLGHVEAIFAGYAKTVDQEWPDFLASRYHAVSLQFDRTLRQVPLWREFKRNAAKETLSSAQIADSTALAREAASALQQGEAASFVDPAIPQALEQLADALPVAKAGAEPPPDAIEAGKELLAADLVESVNNTLKPIAEVALAAAGAYGKGARKGFIEEAKKQGPKDGRAAFKWLRRLAIGGGAGAGSFVALTNLIAKFPEAFGWLERILHLLR